MVDNQHLMKPTHNNQQSNSSPPFSVVHSPFFVPLPLTFAPDRQQSTNNEKNTDYETHSPLSSLRLPGLKLVKLN
jgi:hypothetical protein